MRDKERYYFLEYINMVLKPLEYDYNKNFLMVKHNNAFRLNERDMEGMGMFHSYKFSDMRKPYEPFLDIVKEYLKEKMLQCKDFSIEDFLDKAEVYPLHRKIFKEYFQKGTCERQEELLLREYLYEKKKFQNAVLHMLSEMAKEKPFCLILDEVNLAGSSALWILEEISKNSNYNHIKVIAIMNEEGEVLPFAGKDLKRFIHACEEADMVCNWIFEEEQKSNVRASVQTEQKSIATCIETLKNMFHTLECEQAEYYLKMFLGKMEKERIPLEPRQELELLNVYFWVKLVAEEYADALYICDRMEKLQTTASEDQKKPGLEIELLKTRVHLHNGNKAQMEAGILACKKAAAAKKDETLLFNVELLENIVMYSGWNTIWMTKNDTEISMKLVQKCHEDGYLNHLAHIYAYSFNNDYRSFSTIEGIEERLTEFNKGIALGQELQNEQFLVNAYRKNVMIASVHGYFNVCIYFYEKMLEVVKRTGDEVEEAGIYNGMGYSNCGLERYKEANDYYNKALVLYHKYQLADEIVETLYNLGINAMLAGDYKNAGSYLIEADNILRMLKRSTMKTCNMSKLFGLIALASFRQGIMYHARLYLNKAKQFLSHVLGKKNEETEYIEDDGMFLVYFVSGLMKKYDNNYEEARLCFHRSEFFMRRSTGGMFFNYPEYAFDCYQLLMEMGRETEAKKILLDFREYCEKNKYHYRLQKISAVLGEKVKERNIEFSDMTLHEITLEKISELIKRKVDEKEKKEMVKTIGFFNVLQKFTNNMTRTVKEEVASMLPVFKNYFFIDKAFLIRCMKNENEVVYSDLEYKVSQKAVDYIVEYFKKKPAGFVVSKDGILHEEYNKVVSCFEEEQIFSFAAVPLFEQERLNCVFIVYIEIKNNWTSSKERSILTESDLEIFTYVFRQISNAIGRLEVKNELIAANQKMKEQMEQVLELKHEAEAANVAKSNFLANMSHEIRTPMNAIIGMSEIALRGELSKEQKDNIEQIKSSGTTLLSIINDILDFSKIESGKMDITIEKYQPISIIRDVVNIIITRIGNKNLEFIIDVAPDIPYELLGDSIRIKQIIINLANNAVKFTKQGMVKLTIGYERTSEEEILLKIAVEDTGIGIKKQDLDKLFRSFQQVDSKRNRNIEGTGLGLSIAKQLLLLMGGNITVESEYGQGSIFTCTLPQKIVTEKPNVEVSNGEQLKVVSFIDNFYVKKQLEIDLKQLGITYEDGLSEQRILSLTGTDANYLFIEHALCSEKILEMLEQTPEITGVLLVDYYSTETYPLKNLIVVKKPLYSLELEKIFNREDIYGSEMEEDTENLDFIAPEAEILIVDDNTINLKVAEGLLAPLQMKIDTAASGKEAIDKISEKKYDIVFMDHMMPEVDGVETTHIIRRFYEEYNDVPIIALTANAVSGTREMFLNEGMNDFVAKPIEYKIIVSKIRHWLPKEKVRKGQKTEEPQKKEGSVKIQIEGLDTAYALSLVGEENLYWIVLKDYYQVIQKKMELIRTYEKAEEWKEYTIEVHALKSASRQIGALELADKAERMEKAGNEKNAELIHECTPELLELYGKYQKILAPYFIQENATKDKGERKAISWEILSQLFEELREAFDALDIDQMDAVMEKMEEYEYAEEQQQLYEKLKDAMEEMDIESGEEILLLWEKKFSE